MGSRYLPVDAQSGGGSGGGGVGVEGDGTLLAAALIIAAGLYRGTCNTTGVFTDRSTGSTCTGGPAACNRREENALVNAQKEQMLGQLLRYSCEIFANRRREILLTFKLNAKWIKIHT